MDCKHQEFHTITSQYDRKKGVLVYFRSCESCGARLGEVHRLVYRPRFERERNRRAPTPA
jgi:hypothetical protein